MLEKIIASKKRELAQIDQKGKIKSWEKEFGDLPSPKKFKQALVKSGQLSLIAEIKRASPSAGILAEDLDVPKMARIYQSSGASAISVLTEGSYFRGSLEDLGLVKANGLLPILRKDFILTDYQIWESRIVGADCLLLIASILSQPELKRMLYLTKELGLQALVEIHTLGELEKTLQAGSELIGINNRDLKTFRVDLKTTETIAPLIPSGIVKVSESGILFRADVVRLQDLKINAILIGEAILRSPDPGSKVEELLGHKPELEIKR